MRLNFLRFAVPFLLLVCSFSTRAVTAVITADHTMGCSPLLIHFSSASSIDAHSVLWIFGNGSPNSTATNPIGIYNTGTYTVTLVAYSDTGTDTARQTIVVPQRAHVGFYALDTVLCAGDTVRLVNTTDTLMPTSYLWDFGDGGSANTRDAWHVYGSGGYHSITLIATDSLGCDTARVRTAYVFTDTPINAAFNVSGGLTICRAPSAKVFTSTSSGGGHPYSYRWYFGDGDSSLLSSPSHTYVDTGRDTAVLIVTDAYGCSKSTSRVITVSTRYASFSADTSFCLSHTDIFTNTSATLSPTNTYVWNFGNGVTSSATSPTYTYTAAGTYTVTLVTNNGLNCRDTVKKTVNVWPIPSADIVVSPTSPCPPPVTLTYASTDTSGASIYWIFGDGATGTGTTVSNEYTLSELDTIASVDGINAHTLKQTTTKMILVSSHGCRDTVAHIDTVRDVNIIFGSPTGYSGCVPLTETFSVSGLYTTVPYHVSPYGSGIASYYWDFGGGVTSTSATPTRTYWTVGMFPVTCTITTLEGCTTSLTTYVGVGHHSAVIVAANDTDVCFGTDITFTATRTTSDPTLGYFWHYGDGEEYYESWAPVSTNTQIHNYPHPGTYTAYVFATENGCASNPAYVTVHVDSTQALIGTVYDCTNDGVVTLYNYSTGADSIRWHFNNGYTSTADTIHYTFPSPSLDTVSLTIYDTSNGCTNTATAVLDFFHITPTLLADDTAICRDGVINFTSSVSGGMPWPNYHTWLLNGLVAYTDSTVFTDTFHTTGIYSVSFVVYDSAHNCYDTATRPNYITVAKPVAAFTTVPSSGCSPLPVTLTSTSTDVPGVGFANFIWRYGDGTIASNCLCPSVIHTYVLPATTTYALFTDTLIITDSLGCKDTLIRTDADTVYRVRASFTASPASICLGNPVTFNNTSTSAPGHGRSYYWQFGDGGTDVSTSPSHLYMATGNYVVTLIVTDSVSGCIDTARLTVNVSHPHAAFFMSDSAALCAPLSIHFTNASTGTGLSYAWNFGNGYTSVFPDPFTTYLTPGIDTVTLVVTNNRGCRDTAYGYVRLFGYDGDFSYDSSGCGPLNVHFSIIAGVGADSVFWFFGDGSFLASPLDTTTHTYAHGGSYTPSVVLGNAAGCHVTSTGSIPIRVDTVSASISASATAVCPNVDITFTGTAYSNFSPVYAYHWLFDPADSSNTNPATHAYTLPGNYVTTLVVTDGWNCRDTVTDSILIYPVPGQIEGNDSICTGATTVLIDTTAGGTWSSSNDLVAQVSSTGTVTGISHGTATISYTVTNAFGCSAIRTFDIEVLALPDSGIISGIDSVCLYGTTHLSETIPDGTWHSQDVTIAAVDASGNVSGVALGSTVISYTVFDGHCYNTATFTIRVVTVPSVPPIEGPDSICVIGSAELSDPLAGGTWSSYDPGIAVVDASGVVSGVTTGITTIAYSVSNDCGTTTVTKTIVIVPVEPPVFGPHAVCSGSTINLSSTVAGGTWTSDDETIAIVDETTGVVTGVSSGSTVITYSGESACGPYEVYFNISVNIAPYISTNVMVACQTLANDKTGPIIISGSSGCIKVCDSTTARYYANGVYGSMFTWIVTGGVIVNNYGDSIDVFWTPAGTTGSITLIDTFSHCIGTASACMQVISRPHAEFTASSTNVCLGNTVVFTNLSTADPASPIVSYQWEFGDGTGSSDINPTHAYGASNINSVVTLIVKNACNCTDTFRLYLHIYGDSGVVISCPGIVCDSEIASYSIPADACVGSYAWSVVGGTIISGAGTDVIQVRWDNAYPTGFGYVSVVDACAACPDTSTIKIPVILHHAPITGPSTPCTGQEYIYSLPLWAATQYQWGVLGDPSVKVGFSNDYQLVVNFPTASAYILHGWYQNSLKGCGGNVFDTIKASKSDTMLGPATVCPLTPETYATASGTPISWVVSDVAGTIVGTGAGASFTYTFTAPGLYRISGNGDFCIQPLTVNVLAPPPAFDSVRGEDTVCLGRVYTYNSYSDVPGTICNWQAIGGTVTPSSGSNTVNVRWNAGGTMYLIATRQSMTAPYCNSAPDTLVVIQDSVKLFAKHYDTVCANSHGGVSTIYTRAEWYQWAIIPETRGSITSGLHDMVANILWNDVPGTVPATADVVLTVHKCDSVFTDTVHITILPTPRITITASPQPACPRYPVTLTTTAGGSSYLWNFSDGSPAETTTTNTVTHEFPRNFTSSNTSYPISVTISPDLTAECPVSGTGGQMIDVLPGPVAFISAADIVLCGIESTTLFGTATDNVGPLLWQWYANGTPISTGVVVQNLTVYTPGNYTFTILAGNGCADTASLNIPGCSDTGSAQPCDYPIPTISHTDDCNTIHLSGIPGASISCAWSSAGTYPYYAPGAVTDFTTNVPGIFEFVFNTYYPGPCNADTGFVDTVWLVPDFTYRIRCASGGLDSVTLTDHSTYLSGCNVITAQWLLPAPGSAPPTSLGYGLTRTFLLYAGSTYTVIEKVTYSTPDGAYHECEITHTIVLPELPTVSFTISNNPICSEMPTHFTPTTTGGIVSYYWYFGDGAGSTLASPERAYEWHFPADPNVDTVQVVVTDTIGCRANSLETISVRKNGLSGNTGPGVDICASDAPITLYFNNTGTMDPLSYLWSTGAVTDNIIVDSSGAYWVTIYGPYSCVFTTLSPTIVNLLNTSDAPIIGRTTYCSGDSVRLSGYVGLGASYQWYRDGSLISTSSAITDGGLADGNYLYQLVRTVMDSFTLTVCTDTVADTVTIYALPTVGIGDPEAIDCDLYTVHLEANGGPGPGTYNWSNGATGPVNENIHTGGPVEVWFTDLHGCQATATTSVPFPPSYYFQYLPTGCYTVCGETTPVVLHGPPNVPFEYWEWLQDGYDLADGTSVVAPYEAYTSGNYSLFLYDGLCKEESQPMRLTVEHCSDCGAAAMDATIICTPDDPASYTIKLTIASLPAGTTYTVWTDIGPVSGFTGVLTGSSPYVLYLTFTTLYLPPPSSLTAYMVFTLPSGQKCGLHANAAVPSCPWIEERHTNNGDTGKYGVTPVMPASEMATAMMVFPNPASGMVNVSYDYGMAAYAEKTLTVYDITGRKISIATPADIHGTWSLNTDSWTPGIYIIRMEADGKPLHTQRVVVSH